MNLILHITTRSDWAASQPPYTAASLYSDGFIHCSTPAQAVYAANAHFAGQAGLVLLCIDEDLVAANVVYEDCYETGQKFPHIYGPLNLDAVLGIVDFPPNADGSFSLPPLVAYAAAPILEFDPLPEAIIQPDRLIKKKDIAEHCVLCFFQDVLTELHENGRLRPIHTLNSEYGPHPVYELIHNAQRLTVTHPGLGAPLAAGFMEEIIALGGRHFIACGGAGVLDGALTVGHLVVPETAVRDEGVSYHYLPAGEMARASETAVAAIKNTLDRHQVPYVVGQTWTTDGFYRETQQIVTRRQRIGCLTVEMETAAFCAVAQFRGVTFGQILYGGDDVSGAEWDHRSWQSRADIRQNLFWLAVEACLELG
ncbi:MAG: DUF952 domain-containing protein [Chloroflexota bacterium]